jgi:mono/diheme cytochrome c family protein
MRVGSRQLTLLTLRIGGMALCAGMVVSVYANAGGTEVRAARTWSVPADAAARQNPLAGRSDIVPGGRRNFSDRCGKCHGADAHGTTLAPSLADSHVQRHADGELFWIISSGHNRRGMPGFSWLPEEQRWQIVNYLRTISRPSP